MWPTNVRTAWPVGSVPERDGPVQAARRARYEPSGPKATSWTMSFAGQRARLLVPRRIPELDGDVAARGGQVHAVRAEGDAQ